MVATVLRSISIRPADRITLVLLMEILIGCQESLTNWTLNIQLTVGPVEFPLMRQVIEKVVPEAVSSPVLAECR
jgi:hypothetical protein